MNERKQLFLHTNLINFSRSSVSLFSVKRFLPISAERKDEKNSLSHFKV